MWSRAGTGARSPRFSRRRSGATCNTSASTARWWARSSAARSFCWARRCRSYCRWVLSEQSNSRSTSIDHFVGAGEHRGGNFQANRLGGGQVDRELKERRLFERQFRWLRSLQNAIDQSRHTRKAFAHVGTVRHQTTIPDVDIVLVNGREAMRFGEFEDALPVEICEHVGDHKNCPRHVGGHCRKRVVEIIGFAHAKRLDTN